ncbi:MAG TPA: hypothetical protein VML91_14520 [Burkholderiales bacterium]|nr:hypothetical protein [Burkholderiales bacterium]
MNSSLSPNTVRAALEDGASWDRLDEDAIAHLAHHALFFAGRGHGSIDPLLENFYPEYATRVVAERRAKVFARVRSLIHEGVLRGGILPIVLCHDGDAGIVSTAARDIAALEVVEPASGTRGADLVLKLVITGTVANPGAALGGLLARGDESINAKLAALRPALALKWADRALGAMASAPTGYVFASTVEFWLQWLEGLAGLLPDSARVFDQAARALAFLRETMIEPVVLRARRPPCLGAETAALEVPLETFTASIAPRLRVLAGLAGDSDGMRRALDVWLGDAAPDAS